MLIVQCKALKNSANRTLNDSATNETGRFVSFCAYAAQYNMLAENVVDILNIDKRTFGIFDIDHMPSWGDSVWPMQRQVIESVQLNTDMHLSCLECATEFSDDEFINLETFFKLKLRATVFDRPEKEVQIKMQ